MATESPDHLPPETANSMADSTANSTNSTTEPPTPPHTVPPQEPFKATFVVRNLEGGGTGKFTVQVRPEWAPQGAARFAELLRAKFYDDCRFFKAISGVMAQFGLHGTPSVASQWTAIQDDTVLASNTRGRVTFAATGPGTRRTQLFVNYGNNVYLDSDGFAPFGEVVEGMDEVDRIYSGYGDAPPYGRGPSQLQIQTYGNNYLETSFPNLSYIQSVELVEVVGITLHMDSIAIADEKSSLPISPILLMVLIMLAILACGSCLLARVLGCNVRSCRGQSNDDEPEGSAVGKSIDMDDITTKVVSGDDELENMENSGDDELEKAAAPNTCFPLLVSFFLGDFGPAAAQRWGEPNSSGELDSQETSSNAGPVNDMQADLIGNTDADLIGNTDIYEQTSDIDEHDADLIGKSTRNSEF